MSRLLGAGEHLHEAHPVLDGGLAAAHTPEDAAKDDGRGDVAHRPRHVRRLVPADLPPAAMYQRMHSSKHAI